MVSRLFPVWSVVLAASCVPKTPVTLQSALYASGTTDLQSVLARGVSPDGDSTTSVPPLCSAIYDKREDLVSVLVDAGANTDAACGKAMRAYVEAGRRHLVQSMLKILAAKKTTLIIGSLHRMASDEDGGDTVGVTTAFLKYLESRDDRETAVHAANGGGEYGQKPICAAAAAPDGPMIRQLIAFGVDPNTTCSGDAVKVIGMQEDDEVPAVFLAKFNAYSDRKARRSAIDAFMAARVFAKGATKKGVTSEFLQQMYDTARAEVEQEEAELKAEEERYREQLRQAQEEDARQDAERARQDQEYRDRYAAEHPAPENPVDILDRRINDTLASAKTPPAQTGTSTTEDSASSSDTSNSGAGKPSNAQQKAAAEKARTDKAAADKAAADKAAADKAAADKAAAERERQEYLRAMRDGIRLGAATCPGGDGDYFVHGTRPQLKGAFCIDVDYRASCPNDSSVSTGVAETFVGVNSCFGDTYRISPKLNCKVDQVRVRVTNVRPCD